MKIKEGIDKDHAKKVIDLIKGARLKVQASIHEDTVRVTSKSRDELQGVMHVLRGADLDIELQMVNMRE